MAEERVQRRLAAILAADVVGYSRAMEADEEGTRVRLRSLHADLIDPRIAADGGRIVNAFWSNSEAPWTRCATRSIFRARCAGATPICRMSAGLSSE